MSIEGIVASRPTASSDGGSILVRTEGIIRADGAEPVTGSLLLYVSTGDVTLQRGDRVRFTSRVSVPRLLGLPGEFDFPRYLAFQGVSVIGRVSSQEDIVLIRSGAEESLLRSIDLVAYRLSETIRHAVPDGSVSSVLTALLIGDQKRIPRELADAYTRAGVNHILSISGFHVGIIAVFITVISLWMFSRSEYLLLHCNVRRLALLLAVPAMFVYLFLTGNAPATARSVIMLAALACALRAEREIHTVNTLLLAAFLLIAVNPPTLFDVSFQLSFLSLWGIIIFVPLLLERLPAAPAPLVNTAIQLLAASVAASCATLIPVLHIFNVASLNGILTNFLIVPLLGYGAVLAGFIVLPLVLLFPLQTHLLMWPAAKMVVLSNWFITACTALPVLKFSGITALDMILFLLFMTAATFARNRTSRLRLMAALPLAAITIHFVPHGSSDGRLHVSMLSVGQAESLLLRLPGGETVLVDGGGYLHDTGRDFGQRTLAPSLNALGVKRIDRLISTHDHPDHIGGLAYVVRNFNVGEFVAAESALTAEYAREVTEALAERNVPVRRVGDGDKLTLSEGVTLDVLSPGRSFSPRDVDEMGVNESSLVFRLSYRKFSMLFTADAGFAAEREMMAGGKELQATVLKVGHHGSRYSTSEEFLGKVTPELALISAGAENRFGLPAPQTLKLLADRNIPVYRTDRDGTIELVSDGLSWSVATPYAHKD